jgi:hypothetical protein
MAALVPQRGHEGPFGFGISGQAPGSRFFQVSVAGLLPLAPA